MRLTLVGLSPATKYAAQFRFYNGDGYSDWSQVMYFTTTGDTMPPARVTNLVWTVTGGTFTATWDKVVFNKDGSVLNDFHDYKVTISDGDPATAAVFYSNSESFSFTLDQNQSAFGRIQPTLTITVQARDYTGNLSDPAVATATDPVPQKPSPPVVSTYLGQLVVAWDGLDIHGLGMPYNYSFTEVHVSTVSGFTPDATTLNTTIFGAAKIIVSDLNYGTTYYVRFVAVNKIGGKSDPSDQASGTPVRISGLDIQDGAISVRQINFADQIGGGQAYYGTTFPSTARAGDTFFNTADGYHPYVYFNGQWMDVRDATIAAANSVATAAQTTASGKNKVTYSTSTPGTTANTAGDIWFQKDASGVIIGQWEGTGGTGWAAKTIGNTVIANLDAAKITTGTLDANRIAANTITADKLTVAAPAESLIINGSFSDVDANGMPLLWTTDTATGYSGVSYSTTTVAANVGSGSRSFVLSSAANNGARAYTSTATPAAAGDKITVSAYIKGAAAYTEATAVALNVLCYDTSNNLVGTVAAWTGAVTTSFANYSGIAALPANTVNVKFAVVLTSNTAARTIYVSTVTARRSIGATMIADGTITTTKIQAGAITSDLVGTNQIIASKANIGLAVIDSTNIGSVNAGTITTGVLKSGLTVNVDGTVRPAWSIDVGGNATLNSASILGTLTVGINTNTAANNAKISLQSANYLPGSAGWAIKGDGSVEFQNGTFRGSITGSTISASTISAGTTITSPNISAGTITAGTQISGATITGGTVQTANSGSRVQMDTTGLNLFNASGQNTVSLSTSGNAVMTGLYKSNFSGARVEIDGTYTRSNAADPNAPYAGIRMFSGNTSIWGEMGTGGDPVLSGVTTLQMISPGATANNGSYLRLRSDNTWTLYGNSTGTVSSVSSLNLSSVSSSVNIGGTLISLNATTFAGTVYMDALRTQSSYLSVYANAVYNYVYGGTVQLGQLNRGVGSPGIKFWTGSDGVGLNSVGGIFAVRDNYDANPAAISCGYVYNTGGVSVASDVALKKNITSSCKTSMLAEIVNTPVYEYDIDAGGVKNRTRGVMAHEVSSLILAPESEAVDHKSVDIYSLLATSVGAIQELNATIEELKAQVAELTPKGP